MKLFDWTAAVMICALSVMAPATLAAYEVVSGQGTPMRTAITNEANLQRTIDIIVNMSYWRNPTGSLNVYDKYGVSFTLDERRALVRASQSGQRIEATRIVETVVRRSLGSARIEYLNSNSTEQRKWTVINSDENPIVFVVDEFEGVTVAADGSDFRIQTNIRLEVREDITAAILSINLYDVWGEHMRELRYEWVENVEAGIHTLRLDGPFRNRSEAERFYQSLFFIDSVRLSDGTIIRQDSSEIEEALQLEESTLSIQD